MEQRTLVFSPEFLTALFGRGSFHGPYRVDKGLPEDAMIVSAAMTVHGQLALVFESAMFAPDDPEPFEPRFSRVSLVEMQLREELEAAKWSTMLKGVVDP